MKKRSKKLLSMFMALSMAVTGFSMAAAPSVMETEAAPTEVTGVMGANLTWTFDTQTKTLTISGKGDMSYSGDAPWAANSSVDEVRKVVVESGVTSIQRCAFGSTGYDNYTKGKVADSLTEVEIEGTVKTIGEYAFGRNKKLKYVRLSEGLEKISGGAFFGDESLVEINIPSTVTNMEGLCFSGCSNLEYATLPDGLSVLDIGKRYSSRSTSYEDSHFSGCNLKSIYIPAKSTSSMTSLDCRAFSGNENVEYILMGKISSWYDAYFSDLFYNCSGTDNIYYEGSAADWAKYTHLSAQYYPKEYDVTFRRVNFDMGAGYPVSDRVVADGMTVSAPTAVYLDEDHVLTGWYSDKNFLQEYDFTKPVKSNKTIYAKWQKDLTKADMTISAKSVAFSGIEQKPKVTVKWNNETLVEDRDYTLSYSGNVNVGTAVVTVDGMGDYAGQLTDTFTITPVNLKDSAMTLTETSYVYDGLAKTPGVSVTAGGAVIRSDSDYSTSYSNNINAGTATVTVTGKGNYTGTNSAVFTITPVDISSANVTTSPASYDCDGTPKTPDVTVNLSGRQLAATDYDVSYADNVTEGTATVKVVGKNNYTGTASGSFTIYPAPKTSDLDQCPYDSINGSSYEKIQAFIWRMYKLALGRSEVREDEINYWSQMLYNHERTGADMAFQFCCGEEFKNRNLSDDEFSKIMYRVYMNRERGEGDQDGWTIPLANGANRKWIMAKFVNSPEYTMICWDYGIDRGTLDVPDSEEFAPN